MNALPEERPEVDLSIVIPVYNEAQLITEAVEELTRELDEWGQSYELIIAENGSRDQTPTLARDLAERLPRVWTFSTGEPNYGLALKRGLLSAKGRIAICDEIDICDLRFYRAALSLLEREPEVDFVVGSKCAPGAQDRRPIFRRIATGVLNSLLRVTVGFKGTDTHGLKALRLKEITPIIERCVVDRDMFASELVVRVHRSDRAWREIPIDLREKRPPSVHLLRRVPHVLKHIVRLFLIIRLGRDL
jgi:glycosyltransferase involved in cell wall biosynthesis